MLWGPGGTSENPMNFRSTDVFVAPAGLAASCQLGFCIRDGLWLLVQAGDNGPTSFPILSHLKLMWQYAN